MGKELSLARSEETNDYQSSRRKYNRNSNPSRRPRSPELLDEGRIGISIHSSSNRNKREETTTINKKAKGSKAKDPSATSKASTKDKAPNLDTAREPKSKGHKRHDKDRKPDTEAEGRDCTRRRCASELGIEWIGDFCPDKQPHHLVATHHLYEGSLFRCTKCYKHVWLPVGYGSARELDAMIGSLGAQKGYCKYLDKHRPAKIMIAKLQDLWLAKQAHPNNGEFLLQVLDIMGDREYDRSK